ncbi:MAG TPA: 16S rRNA (guanine(527)-N(7))-methyltransferase RsmG [Erysipelotrichaceae bacterium]|nr:16S rRNA (guanine(527)-N(7))-methyltransferase RsmG [Erysipelotrichaceae bacterium]
MNQDEFCLEAKKYQIDLTEKQLNQFVLYAQLLQEWNEKMNLTAIVEWDEIFQKHFLDSMTIAPFCLNASSLADIGSGAGFPGLVLKIVFPQLHVTLVEPTNKRCNFLKEVISQLQLNEVDVLNERAEDLKDHRESFDVVTARAVANLQVLSELCLPLVRIDGSFVSMKGAAGRQEVADAKNAISLLGGQVEAVEDLLMSDGSSRVNVNIKKVRITPMKYPRAYGQIKKKPL